MLAETQAMDILEAELAADLDFGGISASQVQSAQNAAHHIWATPVLCPLACSWQIYMYITVKP